MSELEAILDPATIRTRTRRVYDAAIGGGTAFRVNLDRLPACVDLVLSVTRRDYPDGRIPLHGRYEHFRAGGIDRVAVLHADLAPFDRLEQTRSLVDLVVVSVLLDGGAGDAWTYREPGPGGGAYARSEGLAIASWHLFRSGVFSSDRAQPFRVTASGLDALTEAQVAAGFQVTRDNPLAGFEGRYHLLKRLASALRASPSIFGPDDPRPGHLVDALMASASPVARVEAKRLLRLLLVGLAPMWTPRVTLDGVGFGDVWPYFGPEPRDWVPLHKLSQWLTYSLIEPIESAGLRVIGVDALTGLPEYRNGGLLIDTGVLELRDLTLVQRTFEARDDVVVEWRALTVQLLDRVADGVRAALGKSVDELPLARVLQGGTWTAGREIARARRPGGTPPLRIHSDGTVF
jgi:hypothetical protein